MNNKNKYDGSKRTKVIIANIDNLVKYNSAKDRVKKRFEVLDAEVSGLMTQFAETSLESWKPNLPTL